jgi:arginyl-tRNA synthetase
LSSPNRLSGRGANGDLNDGAEDMQRMAHERRAQQLNPDPKPPMRRIVRDAVRRAWDQAIQAGTLPPLPAGAPAVDVEVERPADPAHGDFASNLALKLARPYGRPPTAIAAALASALEASVPGTSSGDRPLFRSIEAAPPGFLNLALSDAIVADHVAQILRAGPAYGRLQADVPHRFDVEFVSANPTGPLHVGNARGAFVGDFLSRILAAAGHEVTREYYFNDSGNQVRELGESIRRAHEGEPLDDAPYRGDYVVTLGREVPAATAEAAARAGEDAAWVYGRWASERIRAGIERSLARLGVRFDVWRTEGELYRDGWVDRAIERLGQAGVTYEADGALWFRSTAYGDEKDRVLRRSDGSGTYFNADVGYLEEKFARGFDRLLYVWGADHHGTVGRLRGAAEALGHPPEAVEILLHSWVRFVRGDVEVSMSKRGGTFVTLDELLDEVGTDAARWFFASRSASSPLDFDIELAKRQAPENPVYYVQYAHARIASILRVAAEQGLTPRPDLVDRLQDEVELGLARALLRLPETVEDGATRRETQELTAYAHALAATFHAFYRDRRVVDAGAPEVSGARLALVDATRQVLANTLGLLGISAPESM